MRNSTNYHKSKNRVVYTRATCIHKSAGVCNHAKSPETSIRESKRYWHAYSKLHQILACLHQILGYIHQKMACLDLHQILACLHQICIGMFTPDFGMLTPNIGMLTPDVSMVTPVIRRLHTRFLHNHKICTITVCVCMYTKCIYTDTEEICMIRKCMYEYIQITCNHA